MAFELPPLPYAKTALAGDGMCQETLELHHGKHHQAYVTALNGFVEKNEALKGKSLEEIIKLSHGKADMAPVFNNAGQHWNHILFWQAMSPTGGKHPGQAGGKITADFGGVEQFKDAFKAAGVGQFGSGWAWLVLGTDGKLKITKTPNGSNPLATGEGKALLGIDVWEHSYYLDFRNRRPDYLKNWLDKLANYEFAEAQLGVNVAPARAEECRRHVRCQSALLPLTRDAHAQPFATLAAGLVSLAAVGLSTAADGVAQHDHPHVRRDLHLDLVGPVAHLLHDAEDAAAGDHAVAALQGGERALYLLRALLLRPDQQEIEHAEDQDERHELGGAAQHAGEVLGVGGRDQHGQHGSGLVGVERPRTIVPPPPRQDNAPGTRRWTIACSPRCTRIAEALERAGPPPPAPLDLAAADAFVWHPERRVLRPVDRIVARRHRPAAGHRPPEGAPAREHAALRRAACRPTTPCCGAPAAWASPRWSRRCTQAIAGGTAGHASR